MIRVLVTGAAGSVGRALVEDLLKNGNKVCAFDNSEDGLFKLREYLNEYEEGIKNSENTVKDEQH